MANKGPQRGIKAGRVPSEPDLPEGVDAIHIVSAEAMPDREPGTKGKKRRRPAGDLTPLDRRLMCPTCGSLDKILFGFGSNGLLRRYRCKSCSRAYVRSQAQDAGELVPVEGEGQLRAMRHVTMNGPWHDEKPMEHEMRAWMVKDRKTFFLQLHRLEREVVQDRAIGGMTGPDVNAAKVREVINRLLEEFALSQEKTSAN